MISLLINQRIGLGFAIGVDSENTRHLVHNGILFMNESIEVVEENGFTIPVKLNYDLETLEQDLVDKDGLIHSTDLVEHSKSTPDLRIFSLADKMVFLEFGARPLYEFASSNGLLKFARVKLSKGLVHTRAGLTLKGGPFINLLRKAIKSGEETARLISPQSDDWSDSSIIIHFIIRIVKIKHNEIAFHSWQVLADSVELHYVHGIIDIENEWFDHLDFAYYQTNSEEITSLFEQNNWKPVYASKKKIFRFDKGQLDFQIGFTLMELFFPSDYLVKEFRTTPLFV